MRGTQERTTTAEAGQHSWRPRERCVLPEALEEALRRRVDRIDRVVEELRTKGVDVQDLLDRLYAGDPRLQELWQRVDSDILSQLGPDGIEMGTALEWFEALDAWSTAVVAKLRELVTKE